MHVWYMYIKAIYQQIFLTCLKLTEILSLLRLVHIYCMNCQSIYMHG